MTGLVLVFGLIFLLPFTIKANVDCSSQYGACPPEILTGLAKFNNKSLFFADRGVKKYLKAQFFVSSFSLRYRLPNTLKVDLIIKKPVFATRDISSGTIYLISSDGRTISITKSTSLPILETNISLKIGQVVEPRYLTALHLINGVFEMYQTGKGTIDGESLLVDLPGQIRVIFPLEGDTQVLLGSLRLIYTKITTGDLVGKYRIIDLRFKNPVLR